jgi:site-specific DNA recombinase
MQFQHRENGSRFVVAGYVRRSSEMQRDNYSIEAQKRAIREAAKRHGFPEPCFYEDPERSARGMQLTNRPAFKQLLDDIQAGQVQVVMVSSLDRWARNVIVTLQTFQMLTRHRVTFISLTEQIDYSTPEGRLQLTILAAFAAYCSDMLARHVSKGKGERAAQGLFNGDLPFGYRSTGSKMPPEFDPLEYPGLRLIGELRIQGYGTERIADALNAAGYRSRSKRNGARLFTGNTVAAILRNEFYAAYAPEDDRGIIKYHQQRYRGLHPAAVSYEEWQQIHAHDRPRPATHPEQTKRVYEFAGYISCLRCGLALRCASGGRANCSMYYRDTARSRRLPCPASGNLWVRAENVAEQFGAFLHSLVLPENWLETLRHVSLMQTSSKEQTSEMLERERERLRLRQARAFKRQQEEYLDEEEQRSELAALAQSLRKLEQPEGESVTFTDMREAGEHITGMAALWNVATLEERSEMVLLLLEPGGLCYDLERQILAAVKPRPVFSALFRLLIGSLVYKKSSGLFFTQEWLNHNRENDSPSC